LPKFATGVREFGRPFLMGEMGIAREVETKYGFAGDLQDQDTRCFSVKEGLWAGLFGGAAGSGMSWWWDEHIDRCDGYHRFRAISKFVKDIAFNHEGFVRREPPEAAAPPLVVYELAGRDTRLFWVRHPQLNWYNEAIEKTPRPPIDATLTVRGVQPGIYEVEIWSTDLGEPLSTQKLRAAPTLEIPLENFRDEVAVKVKPTGR
jgi:hypothetical protein